MEFSSIDPARSASPHIRRMLRGKGSPRLFNFAPPPILSDVEARRADADAMAQDWQLTLPYIDHDQLIESLRQRIIDKEQDNG